MFHSMGQRTPLKGTEWTRRPAALKPTWSNVDIPLLATIFVLLIFGLVMVFSASTDYSYLKYDGDSWKMFTRQIGWVLLGVLVMLFLAYLVDYHIWDKNEGKIFGISFSIPFQWATLAWLITLVMLILVFVVGEDINNAQRTLLKGSIQPSELAKPIIILYLAVWLYRKGETLNDAMLGLAPLGVIIGITAGLIVAEPDFSATITIVLLAILMFFLAGAKPRQILIFISVTIFLGIIGIRLSTTAMERVRYFVLGLQDTGLSSFHVSRALEAFVNGGWFGVGLGRSVTKVTGLPVPPTDSIFAVIGEETGTFGAAVVVGLYTFLAWRGLTIARRAPDQLGMLVASGITFWLSGEAFINMASLVNLVPFTGNALPLMSYGGSNMVTTLFAIGILLGISRSQTVASEGGNLFGAVIDLRRRDGRRRVSGARRSSGTQ